MHCSVRCTSRNIFYFQYFHKPTLFTVILLFFTVFSLKADIIVYFIAKRFFLLPLPPPSKLPESIPILLITAWKTQPRAINRSEEEKSTANGLAENLLVWLCAAFQPQQTHLFEKLICWNWYSCMFEICSDSLSLSIWCGMSDIGFQVVGIIVEYCFFFFFAQCIHLLCAQTHTRR